MKHLVFAALFLIPATFAESNARLIRAYGIKGAITSADQDYEITSFGEVETKRRLGVNVALYAEWLDLPFISIVAQVEYVQRGVGQEFILTGPSSPEEIGRKTYYSRLDYLSFPVLVKARFSTGDFRPYVIAGPRFDLFLGYKSDENLFNSVYDDFKKSSIGSSIGVGAETNVIFPVILSAEVRYNVDFSYSYRTDNLKVRNNAFDFWVGVGL